ncbi:MAG: M20/M25/M40 family metallo-hydrolase [Clostridiales bacterium]|nr:M20/M25/M40 family metallo-hydrolase [Clostridiales bacterium]
MEWWQWLLAAIGAFILITLIRAVFFTPKKKEAAALEPEQVDVKRYEEHLSQAIQIPTISYPDPKDVDWTQFEKFHAFLEKSYPLIHSKLEKEVVSYATLMFRWKGKNPDLDPIAMLAHQDVVPVTEGTEQDWEHPAFEGYNDGEFIWGRGALDIKNHLIGVMESVETLLEEGFEPERDVYLCFAHDEEVMSTVESGANTVVNILSERGIHLDSVIDEGGAILPVQIKGVMNKYLAGIGVAEKGYADFEVAVTAKGGHSSQPPKHTALGQLADVIKNLENHQFKSKLSPMMMDLFMKIGRNVSYPARIVTCNLPILKPLVTSIMKTIPPAACMIRTTTAVTQSQGSPAANVLPQRASVVVNFRIMPGMTIADVEKHIKKVAGNKNVEVNLIKGKEPSKYSPTTGRTFKALEDICYGMNTDNIVAPYLVMGGTDACKYEPVCENIYRYSPFLVNTGLLLCTHGTNERIPVAGLADGLAFFKRYIKMLAGS